MLSQEDTSVLIRKALELPDGFELAPERKIATVPGWDSIGWLNVICAIEEAAQKQVPIEALDDVHSLADLFALVSKL
jgi:acyl carrier protein